MAAVQSLRNMIIKIAKLVLNIIALIMYRTGFAGEVLGVGGTWNLNEERNADAEIVASGVFVGYLIFTSVQIIADCFRPSDSHRQLTDVIMTFVGIFMWLAVGGASIHYWQGYMAEEFFQLKYTEKDVGLALGGICILNGIVYLVDTVLAMVDYYRENAQA